MHYATRRPLADGECLAVYDLGGGTFDATVVQNQGGSIVILAQDGIERLGGVDFDDALWQHCVVASHGALAELDFRDRPTTIAVGQLRQHISAAKEALSRDTEATIPVFLPDRNFLVTVTRAQFEDMIRASIESTIGTLLRTLRTARITPDQLSAVLLVGGSSRIPLVQQMLSEQLGRPTVVDAHPKYAVALGAAQLAHAAAAEQPHQPPLISDDLEQTTVFAPVPPQPETVPPETARPETAQPETVQPETAPAEPPPSAPAGRPATDTGSLPLFGGYQGEEPGHDPGYDPGYDTDADATIAYGSAAPATAAGPSRGGGSSVPPTPTAVAEHAAPGDTGHPSDSPSPPLGGARPRPGRSRSRLVTAVAVLTVVLVVLGWLTYTVVRPAASTPPTPAGVASGAPRPVDPGPAAVAAPEQSQSGPDDGAAAPQPTAAAASSVPVPSLGATIPVGATPGFVVVSPNGRQAYVANRAANQDQTSGTVTVVDTAANRVTATIPVPAGPAQYLAFSPDGRTIYVSIWNQARTIAAVGVLDTTTNTITATIPVRTRPFLAAVTPDGRQLYVPNHDSGSVSVIDTATTTVTDDIKVAANPHWVEFSTDGRFAYTANHESNLVSILDVSTHSVIAEVPVGKSPHSVAVHPTRPLVANVNYDDASVTFLNTEDRGVETIRVGDNPQDITWAPDGRFAYTTNVNDNSVSVINAETKTVTASIPTGDSPTSIAVLPNGRAAYVTNLGDGTLTVLNTGH